ncbi:hypothetical protein LXL04_029371 [Taraxacum kok-saghyz]
MENTKKHESKKRKTTVSPPTQEDDDDFVDRPQPNASGEDYNFDSFVIFFHPPLLFQHESRKRRTTVCRPSQDDDDDDDDFVLYGSQQIAKEMFVMFLVRLNDMIQRREKKTVSATAQEDDGEASCIRQYP